MVSSFFAQPLVLWSKKLSGSRRMASDRMQKTITTQKMLVREYLLALSATNAVERAGYRRKTAHVQGARLLVNVSVSAINLDLQTKRFPELW